MKRPLFMAALVFGAVALNPACKNQGSAVYAPRDNSEERAKFCADYNRKVARDLADSKAELEKALAGDLSPEERKTKQQDYSDLGRHLKDPDYFQTRTQADLPANLNWEDGMGEPDLGSPEAKKGGTYHTYMPGNSFPPTLRALGREANNSFRSNHWDDIELGLTSLHPNTGKIIPGIADQWAVSEDGQNIYYHIDSAARWSDGRKVTSGDFTMAVYIYLSPYLTEAFYRDYYGQQFWGITTYGPDYVCLRLAYPKPLAAATAALQPFQEDYYKEFGPDFESRYNWRPRPTTGAYEIRKEDILKGRSIAMSRVKNWWAKDKKYYRNRFNADRIEYSVILDDDKVFQLFLRGDIDAYMLNEPLQWYEKTATPDFFNGYVEKATFYNEFPAPTYGLYLNEATPLLANQDIRIGLQHATNWEKVIKMDLRGDAERMNLLAEGFGEYSNPNVRTRPFSVEKAREAFAKAGFTTTGPDGILQNAQGQRLSFLLTFARTKAIYETMMQRLAEEAKRAGVEYRLEPMDSTAAFQKEQRKEHEISFSAWLPQLPFPDYYQSFYSTEAYEPGSTKPKPMSNNICSFADKSVDPVLEENRNASSAEAVKQTSYKLEEIFNERAVWVPAYLRPFYRVGYWRWMKWPKDFNVRFSYEFDNNYVYWIDEDVKKETLDAKRADKPFPEQNLIFDQYRKKREAN